MNNDRRKDINRAIALLQGIADAFEEAKGIIEQARDDEEESFNNLPEGLQQAERGQLSEEAKGHLDEAFEALDGCNLDDVIASCENAAQ